MKICAAVSRGAGEAFSIEAVELQAPAANEVLVRIAGVGLCHSDLLARDGIIPVTPPAVLGHEGAGVIVARGSGVTTLEVGDHVVLTFAYCGHCQPCERGDQAYCDHAPPLNFSGGRMDGSRSIARDGETIGSHFFGQSSFATFALAYEENAVRIDRDLPLEIMGPLGCGVQTGAGAVMNSLACREGSSLLILGGGSVGLSAVLGAVVQRCATIVVSEPHAARRSLALELGATHALDPREEDVAAFTRGLLPNGVDYAIDTTGVAAVIDQAVTVLGPRGALALVGVPTDPSTVAHVPVWPMLALGQRVMGVVEGDSVPQQFIPLMLEKFKAGLFPFDKLITRYPLERINEAVEDHQAARCVKAVMIP